MLPLEDPEGEHPIPSAWRPTFRAIVAAFAAGDLALAGGVEGVEAPTPDAVSQIRDYLADYGEALVELPEESWASSVSSWQGGHWDCLVDLWTEEGESDLVLGARVWAAGEGYRFRVEMVYVP